MHRTRPGNVVRCSVSALSFQKPRLACGDLPLWICQLERAGSLFDVHRWPPFAGPRRKTTRSANKQTRQREHHPGFRARSSPVLYSPGNRSAVRVTPSTLARPGFCDPLTERSFPQGDCRRHQPRSNPLQVCFIWCAFTLQRVGHFTCHLDGVPDIPPIAAPEMMRLW